MENGEKERYITIGRAANMLGLDPQTVRKMVDSQKIAGFKTPSGQRRVDKQDIRRFCNNLLPDQEIVSVIWRLLNSCVIIKIV